MIGVVASQLRAARRAEQRLCRIAKGLTEALRGGSLDGADELFPPVEKEYQRVVEALKALE